MPNRTLVIPLAALVLAAVIVTVIVAPRLLPGLRPAHAPMPLHLPSLAQGTRWWNSAPLTPDSLRQRPVALLLWSDTDPRGLAALPVFDAWHRSFAPLGVRVVAVHEPAFGFATDSSVTGDVVRRLGLALPVADDPGGLVEAVLGGNVEGPHVVVADPEGKVIVDTLDDLSAAEAALRRLVARTHPGVSPPGVDPSLPQDVRTVWLGAGRVEDGPLRALSAGHERVFTAEFRYQESGRAWVPYPVGGWRTGSEGLTASRGGAANFVAIRYSAARAGVVVTPPPGQAVRMWILRDDRWPRPEERGEDVVADARGAASITVTGPRIYWIDRGEGERVIKLSPEVPGVMVNAFVFTGAH